MHCANIVCGHAGLDSAKPAVQLLTERVMELGDAAAEPLRRQQAKWSKGNGVSSMSEWRRAVRGAAKNAASCSAGAQRLGKLLSHIEEAMHSLQAS